MNRFLKLFKRSVVEKPKICPAKVKKNLAGPKMAGFSNGLFPNTI
jgi:hypothetical protein